MKKIILFALSVIPWIMNAQNTAPNAQPAAFVGTYSFTDANGSEGSITINNPSKTEKDYDGKIEKYFGTGSCVFAGATNYFYWGKWVKDDHIEMTFSKADFPAIAIKGKSYKTEINGNSSFSGIAYYIKNGWLYYDQTAVLADNPNLKIKLTKK
ncbi:MAG: hypothetical protein IKX51_02410 [Bacteroidales bacterium]|nr:hypothetical protein [Bacteroidales bacterium]